MQDAANTPDPRRALVAQLAGTLLGLLGLAGAAELATDVLGTVATIGCQAGAGTPPAARKLGDAAHAALEAFRVAMSSGIVLASALPHGADSAASGKSTQ